MTHSPSGKYQVNNINKMIKKKIRSKLVNHIGPNFQAKVLDFNIRYHALLNVGCAALNKLTKGL